MKDGVLIKDKVYCGICSEEFKYQGTCGNLQTHLKNVHHITEETGKPQEQAGGPIQEKIDHIYKPCASIKYKEDHAKQRRFRQLACQWIVKTLRPLNIMDDKAFKEMIYHADIRLTVPSSSTVTRTIKMMYTSKFNQTVEAFKGINYFWGTTDAGTSFASKTYRCECSLGLGRLPDAEENSDSSQDRFQSGYRLQKPSF